MQEPRVRFPADAILCLEAEEKKRERKTEKASCIAFTQREILILSFMTRCFGFFKCRSYCLINIHMTIRVSQEKRSRCPQHASATWDSSFNDDIQVVDSKKHHEHTSPRLVLVGGEKWLGWFWIMGCDYHRWLGALVDTMLYLYAIFNGKLRTAIQWIHINQQKSKQTTTHIAWDCCSSK